MRDEATPSWERSKFTDDGRPLSITARTLLTVGESLLPKKTRAPVEDETFAEKYEHYFRFFPHAKRCDGDVVIELGGGTGELSTYLAQWAKQVYCIEPNPTWAGKARKQGAGQGNMEVVRSFGQDVSLPDAVADRIILYDVLEHVAEPLSVLREASRLLKPDGEILASFVPWFSPYGGHTWSFLPVPWLHVLYSQKVLAEMRSAVSGWHTTELGATGLYRITLSQFKKMAHKSGLNLSSLELLGIRGQQWMTRVPALREFGTSVVAARLTPQ